MADNLREGCRNDPEARHVPRRYRFRPTEVLRSGVGARVPRLALAVWGSRPDWPSASAASSPAASCSRATRSWS